MKRIRRAAPPGKYMVGRSRVEREPDRYERSALTDVLPARELERLERIELSSRDWQTRVLPLNDSRNLLIASWCASWCPVIPSVGALREMGAKPEARCRLHRGALTTHDVIRSWWSASGLNRANRSCKDQHRPSGRPIAITAWQAVTIMTDATVKERQARH